MSMSIPPTPGPEPGIYIITSGGGKGGVVGIEPRIPLPFQQLVTFPQNDFSHKWQVTRTDSGTYLLSILDGYRYTGAQDHHRVIATVDESQSNEWEITSFQYQGPDLYVIQVADPSKLAWTADNIDSEEPGHIIVEPLRTAPSLPPQAFPYQLFQMRRA